MSDTRAVIDITSDTQITITPSSSYAQYNTGGIIVSEIISQGPQTGSPSAINAQNVILDMTAAPANVGKIGLNAHSAGIYRGKTLSVDIVVNNQSNSFFHIPSFGFYSYTLYNYGILAGNSVDSGPGSAQS